MCEVKFSSHHTPWINKTLKNKVMSKDLMFNNKNQEKKRLLFHDPIVEGLLESGTVRLVCVWLCALEHVHWKWPVYVLFFCLGSWRCSENLALPRNLQRGLQARSLDQPKSQQILKEKIGDQEAKHSLIVWPTEEQGICFICKRHNPGHRNCKAYLIANTNPCTLRPSEIVILKHLWFWFAVCYQKVVWHHHMLKGIVV